MTEKFRNYRYTINVDSETREQLEYIQTKTYRPISWIVKRLIEEEYERVKKSPNKSRDLEVVVR